ncbi:MAG: iron chelate uptake ABC transporter family permease subunit [Leucobacter sp.]
MWPRGLTWATQVFSKASRLTETDAAGARGVASLTIQRPAIARRRFWFVPASLLLLAVALALSLTVGARAIPADRFTELLLHPDGSADSVVIWFERVPRTIAATVVGIGVGVAGALMQALTRNPLADPGILGVNAGAALFVGLGVAVFGISSATGYVWLALAGALGVTLAVYAIGSIGPGGVDPSRLTLAGVALGAVLAGIVTALTLLDPQAFERMRHWSAGSLVSRGLDITLPVLPFIMGGLLLAGCSARPLNAMAVGDDLAKGLGVSVTRTRAVVIVAVTLLAGGATAIAGPVAFVGLMVPHVARWAAGPDHRWVIGGTLLLAPTLMLTADVLGRVVLAIGEVPVGIVTAFVGAPILIVLVRRRRMSEL